MRLPRPFCELPALPWPALVAIGAAVPPAALHAALASAAGTLFEAAPFVLAAEVLPQRHAAALECAGCGCGRRGFPGALSLPATALCWLAFGPWVALARLAAALVLLRRGPPAPGALARSRPDALAELRALAVSTVVAALALAAIGTHVAELRALWPVAFALGAFLGAVVPCATAAVAIAAGFAHPLPAVAAGLLASAGLVPLPARSRPKHSTEVARAATDARAARLASALLAFALAAIAWRGPSGLVNPRLVPLDAAAAVLALAGTLRRRTSIRGAELVGAGLVCALAGGYAIPPGVASETTLAGAFPGERLEFTGVAHRDARGTLLQRFAIACCRLDATAVAVRLTSQLAVADGTWVAMHGTFVREGVRFAVRPEQWRVIPAPPDPFVYR